MQMVGAFAEFERGDATGANQSRIRRCQVGRPDRRVPPETHGTAAIGDPEDGDRGGQSAATLLGSSKSIQQLFRGYSPEPVSRRPAMPNNVDDLCRKILKVTRRLIE